MEARMGCCLWLWAEKEMGGSYEIHFVLPIWEVGKCRNWTVVAPGEEGLEAGRRLEEDDGETSRILLLSPQHLSSLSDWPWSKVLWELSEQDGEMLSKDWDLHCSWQCLISTAPMLRFPEQSMMLPSEIANCCRWCSLCNKPFPKLLLLLLNFLFANRGRLKQSNISWPIAKQWGQRWKKFNMMTNGGQFSSFR